MIKLFPTALVVVIVTTLSCWFWKLNDKGVIILNSIPGGFAPPSVPALLDFATVKALLVPAVLISVVGFVESNAIAKVIEEEKPLFLYNAN